MLRDSDVVSAAVDGMGGGRTDAEREVQGEYFYTTSKVFFSYKFM